MASNNVLLPAITFHWWVDELINRMNEKTCRERWRNGGWWGWCKVSVKSDELLNVFTLERAHNNAPCTVIAFSSYECSTGSIVESHNTREQAGSHLFRHSQYMLCNRRVIGIHLMTESSVLALQITSSLFLHHKLPHRITSNLLLCLFWTPFVFSYQFLPRSNHPIPSNSITSLSLSLSQMTLRSHHSPDLTCIRHPDKAYISY